MGDGTEVRENCTIHDSVVGEGCGIYEKVSLKKSIVKDRSVVNAGTYLEYVEVGEGVLIGPNCSIVGVFHQVLKTGVAWDDTFKKITIRKGVFIGAGSVILPGVEIGEGSVIGAGSTITHDIPSFHICFGTPPNQTIKSLKDWLERDLQETKKLVRILFVCYGNAARSVMAEYFCNTFGEGRIIAESAGTHPFLEREITPELQGRLLRATRPAMKELGIDVSSHRSRHIQQADISSFDMLVNMSPISFMDLLNRYSPDFKGTVKEWSVPDPGDSSLTAVRMARDTVKEKVLFLIKEIKGGR